MSDAVLGALITAIGSLICQILINRSNRRKRVEEDAQKELERAKKEADKEKARAVEEAIKAERLENRLASIEDKLDTHNGYAEKLGNIETDIAVIKNDVKTLYKARVCAE